MKYFTKSALPSMGDRAARGIKQAFELINPHLYCVEERIRQQVHDFDPAVEGYIAHALESHGKRLRPALTLLTGGATGNISSEHIDLAVIVELIHLATLVHDDIIDGAELRRDQPTANARWGNTLSVLLGDCLFAHALKLASAFRNNEITRRIAHAASDVCSGEIIQTQRRFDLKLSVADYYKIIEMKTAALFAVAAELGAFVNEPAPEVILAAKNFGTKLGTAYQIYDDCLDIAGDENAAGKTLGSDLRKGKLTLPMLTYLQAADESQRHRISEIILKGSDDELDDLAERVRVAGGVSNAVAIASRMVNEAMTGIEVLPAPRFRQGMRDVGSYLLDVLARFARN